MMMERLGKLKDIMRRMAMVFPGAAKTLFRNNIWGAVAFILAGVLGVFLINLTLARGFVLNQIKAKTTETADYLNEFGLDLAWENYDTSAIYTRPLIRFDKLVIYRPGVWTLEIPELRIKTSPFNSRTFYFNFGEEAVLRAGEESYRLRAKSLELRLSTDEEFNLAEILAQIKELSLKGMLKAEELNIAGRRIGQYHPDNRPMSMFENHIEVRNIRLDGSVEAPLSPVISRVYLKTNFIGWLRGEGSITAAMEDWLHHGGYVAIPTLIVNWPPLNLVARGEINFNEKLQPSLHLMTSSKALMRLLEDLQKLGFLESKGVFVAKILLGNKSFKLNPDDQDLTVITPVDFRDGKLAVENITVRRFDKPEN